MRSYNAIKNMSANSTANSLCAVLNFDEETAKTALSEIGSSDATYMISPAIKIITNSRTYSKHFFTHYFF